MINQTQLKGNWQQFKGKLKQKLGRLTDDDLLETHGDSDLIIGKIKERYGITKNKAAHKLNRFLERFDDKGHEATSLAGNISDFAEQVNDKAHALADNCRRYAKEKPIATFGVVVAAGALLGMLISRL